MIAALAAAGMSPDFKFKSCSHEPQLIGAKDAASGGFSHTKENRDDPMDLSDSQSHSRTDGLLQAALGCGPLAELMRLGASCSGERQPALESSPVRSRKRPPFLRPDSDSPQQPVLAEASSIGSLRSPIRWPVAAVPPAAQTYLQLTAEQQQLQQQHEDIKQQDTGGKRHQQQFPKDASLAPMQWQQQESGRDQWQQHQVKGHHQNQQLPRDKNPNPNPNQWQQQHAGGQQHRQQPTHTAPDTDALQMQQQAHQIEARGQQQAAAAKARQQHASFMPVRLQRQPLQQQYPQGNSFPTPSARDGRNGHEAVLMHLCTQTCNAGGKFSQAVAATSAC